MKKLILICLFVSVLSAGVVYIFPQMVFGDGSRETSAERGMTDSHFTLEYVKNKINAQFNEANPQFQYSYNQSPALNILEFVASGNNYFNHIIFTQDEIQQARSEFHQYPR